MSEVSFEEMRNAVKDVFLEMEADIRQEMGEVNKNGGREN